MGAFWPSRCLQDRPESAQDTPKSAPRCLQDRPKRPPRPPQEASKTSPGGLEDAKTLQEASGEPFGTHFASMLGTIWTQKPSPHRPADNCSRGSYKTPPDTRTLPRTNQKPSPTPLNDDSTCRQNRRATPQNEGAAIGLCVCSACKGLCVLLAVRSCLLGSMRLFSLFGSLRLLAVREVAISL